MIYALTGLKVYWPDSTVKFVSPRKGGTSTSHPSPLLVPVGEEKQLLYDCKAKPESRTLVKASHFTVKIHSQGLSSLSTMAERSQAHEQASPLHEGQRPKGYCVNRGGCRRHCGTPQLCQAQAKQKKGTNLINPRSVWSQQQWLRGQSSPTGMAGRFKAGRQTCIAGRLPKAGRRIRSEKRHIQGGKGIPKRLRSLEDRSRPCQLTTRCMPKDTKVCNTPLQVPWWLKCKQHCHQPLGQTRITG